MAKYYWFSPLHLLSVAAGGGDADAAADYEEDVEAHADTALLVHQCDDEDDVCAVVVAAAEKNPSMAQYRSLTKTNE